MVFVLIEGCPPEYVQNFFGLKYKTIVSGYAYEWFLCNFCCGGEVFWVLYKKLFSWRGILEYRVFIWVLRLWSLKNHTFQ